MENELEAKLANIDTFVFPDVDDLTMMNRYAQSCGHANYASMISVIISNDVKNAYSFLKKYLESLIPPPAVGELLAKINAVEESK